MMDLDIVCFVRRSLSNVYHGRYLTLHPLVKRIREKAKLNGRQHIKGPYG